MTTNCANHPGAASAGRCVRCTTSLCDPCLTFIINGAPWCEPCGDGEIESGKGRPVLAAIVFVVLFATWAGLIAFQLMIVQRIWYYSLAGIIVPFTVGWRILFPPTAGEPPAIVDRRIAGSALPPPPPPRPYR